MTIISLAAGERGAIPSPRPGMGAIPHEAGCTFRVWAPFARSVHVAGRFNGWSPAAHPLASEGNGYWSAEVQGARKGDEYKFVIDGSLWRNDPYARDVTSSVGNSIVVDTSFHWEPFRTPPWNEWVVYELHLGTFNDEAGGPSGTLEKAIQKLDYLKDLGINAIELMPGAEFAGGFSWGYNPAHIFAIESDLGNPEQLKTFIGEAHARGIAVVQDVVYNHFGPSDLDLWQFDGWSRDGKGGIYFYNDQRSSTPWGDTRPDYGRGEVRRFIRDNALMWLEDYNMDGLRWDATACIRKEGDGSGADIPDGWSLMQWINDEIDARFPWKLSIAEDMKNNDWLTRTTGEGGAGFDSQWDARFCHLVREALISPHDGARDMERIGDAVRARFNGKPLQRVLYTESHDEVANGKSRLPEEIWPGNAGSWFSRKRSILGAALVFTSPGIPMIFQGQEFLEDQFFRDDDPLDWTKAATYDGILNLYRDLIRLRRNGFDNTRGLRGEHVNVHHVNNGDKVIAFHRWENGGRGDDVVVVLNFADRAYGSYTLGFPREGLWKVRLNSDWSGYSGDFGNAPGYDTTAAGGGRDGMPFHGNVGIGPYSFLILSQ